MNFSPQFSWRGPVPSNSWGNTAGIPMFQPHQNFQPSSSSQVPMTVSRPTGPSQANFAAFSDAFSALNMTPSSSNNPPTALNLTHMSQPGK
ncbi:hypothetical protein RHMOL_Rhmol09G0203500 [Rhododendron molle]|uniref:Uncharacterized protein n=1 Tax=Rhododendron molle TaxID=49168 RepID=A0ACC0MG06_RHOML|nr:hypothetical protein RHMOL_Rhmol09G0203500 [Rhododendron molle]